MYVFSALAGIWYVTVGALILTRSGPSGVILGLIITACGCTMTASSMRARRGNPEAPRHVRRSSTTLLAVIAATVAWWMAMLIHSGEYTMIYAARDKLLGPILALVTAPAIVVLLTVRKRRTPAAERPR